MIFMYNSLILKIGIICFANFIKIIIQSDHYFVKKKLAIYSLFKIFWSIINTNSKLELTWNLPLIFLTYNQKKN